MSGHLQRIFPVSSAWRPIYQNDLTSLVSGEGLDGRHLELMQQCCSLRLKAFCLDQLRVDLVRRTCLAMFQEGRLDSLSQLKLLLNECRQITRE